VYIATTPDATNIGRVEIGTFVYVCDVYSQLENLGETPYDQTRTDRIVGVFGQSNPTRSSRRAALKTHPAGLSKDCFGYDRDKGHFIAHCIGGVGLDINVFSQERNLNRGWSESGKTYRQMERYCYEHAGTFCFSRPVYAHGSSVPRWLEIGVMEQDGSL
jgi:hypothetical protein